MNGDGIRGLLAKYGAGVGTARQHRADFEAMRLGPSFMPPSPDTPALFSPEEVAGLGLTAESGEPFVLEAGWQLKLTPGANGAEPTFSLITPEKWEVFEDQSYLSPEGQRYTLEELEAAGTPADEEKARVKEASKIAGLLTQLAKYVIAEAANKITYDALQIHGGTGYMKEFAIERLVRDARIIHYLE